MSWNPRSIEPYFRRHRSRAWGRLRGLASCAALAALVSAGTGAARAENCVTQSQMSAADRAALASTARELALKVAANDTVGLRAATIPAYAQDFSGIGSSVASTAPHVQGAQFTVRSVYILDASSLKALPDGTLPTAQFFCSLNNSTADTNFTIPGLPGGKYALATVDATGTSAPWQLSFVLQQVQARWLLAGFIPKPATEAGHGGVWYWTQARVYAKKAEPLDAWLYYQAAEQLLVPVDFVSSTNLEKLHAESQAVRPPGLQFADHPMPLKGNGETFMVTSLATDDALGGLDLVVHVTAANTSDPVAARQRNIRVMQALLAAYPEVAQAFHGLWVFADAPGSSPFGIELPMAQVPPPTQSLLLPPPSPHRIVQSEPSL